MQKAFKDIIEKLKEEKTSYYLTIANTGDEKLDAIYEAVANAIDTNILIVNKVAEEYKDKFVSVEVLKQIMWERDVAIEQLHELGYEFGQKIDKSTEHINCSTDSSTEEVCEWKSMLINARVKYSNCESAMDNVSILGFKYCPYCGKQIKIIK